MSILDRLFGGAPQAQTMAPGNPNLQAQNGHGPASAQNQPFQQGQNNGQPNGQNPNVQDFPGMKTPAQTPANDGSNPNGGGQADPPMKEFVDLFKVQEPNKNAITSPFATFDANKFQEQLANTDLVSGVLTPELIGKISAGGEDAVRAMAVLINKVGQETLSKAVQFSVRTADLGFNKSRESVFADLPNHIRNQTANSELYQQHPNLRNPAAKPYIDDLTQRLIAQHPNATEAEIAGMVSNYFTNIGELFTKPADKPGSGNGGAGGKPANGGTDWSSFLG